ncbi:hypothetical protein CHS0354_034088 [Potamilus streckersoni]|uniref:Uncharacterized protein n=1 Tax=Potamilus streckersoni TaxID=2493646 RepID=A0AAE0TAV4_9BIVA|nr:hypothetical protein CHS0354_034088 [Potamilus streckersoni]
MKSKQLHIWEKETTKKKQAKFNQEVIGRLNIPRRSEHIKPTQPVTTASINLNKGTAQQQEKQTEVRKVSHSIPLPPPTPSTPKHEQQSS